MIAALPRRERPRFIELCEPIELVAGETLCEADARYDFAYFPLRSSISLVADVQGHSALELGLIGNEGMLGATLALGLDFAPLRAVVHSSGNALRIAIAPMRRALRDHPALAQALSRYVYVQIAQLAQTAACARFHTVEARLARWLLMTDDRAHADHFRLTHQTMAENLGVRRSAVTIAAGALHDRELIRYSRGSIRVIDRDGLEGAACVCYDTMRENHTQHFAPRLGRIATR